MTTLESVSSPEQPHALDRFLARLYLVNWEALAYAIIFVVAVFTRFVNLGDRVMSHDESLHTKYSWDLYRSGNFQHTPLMHGPVLFHMTAFFYLLFGDNDYSARIYPAILSVLMVMMPVLWRRWLGRTGALLTSVMFLISPMLMYYGRYIREDTPSIFYTLLMFYAIFQYVDGPERVRGKAYWLYLLAGGMILSLASKEVAFFYIAIFGSFLTLYWVIQLAQAYLKVRAARTLFYLLTAGIILGVIAALGMVVIFSILPPAQMWSTTGGFYVLSQRMFGRFIVWTLTLLIILGVTLVGSALWALRGSGRRFPWREVVLIVLVAAITCLLLLVLEEKTRIEPTLATPADPNAPQSVTTGVVNNGPIILAWVVGALAAALAVAGRLMGFFDKLKAFKVFDVLMIMGSLILPWLTAIVIYAAGARPTDYTTEGIVRAIVTFIPFAAVSVAAGLAWNWRVWLAATAIFMAIFVFFFTTMFTNGQGLASGMIGSLGYWLEQQEVRRGNQPQYYYILIMTPLYEFLPLIGALAAGVFGLTQMWRFWRRSREAGLEIGNAESATGDVGAADATLISGERQTIALTVEASSGEAGTGPTAGAVDGEALPIPAEVPAIERLDNRVPFLLFVAYWAVMEIFVLTLAGEKMPWLTTHITVPLILLTGWYGGRIIEEIRWPTFRRYGWQLLILAPLFLIAFAQVVLPWFGGQYPFQGLTQPQLMQTGAWLAAFLTAAGAVYIIARVVGRIGWGQTWRTLMTGAGILLALITLRFALMACFINYDYATEFLVYAHSGPAFRTVMDEIEEFSRRTTDGLNIRVAYGDEAWPSSWYFRNYRNAVYFGSNPSVQVLDDAVAVVVSEAGRARVEPLLGDRYYHFSYVRMWWPMQDYFNLTIDRLDNAWDLNPANTTAANIRRGIWDIWWRRDYTTYGQAVGTSFDTTSWPLSDRMHFYVRKDVAAQIWDMGVGAQVVSEFDTSEADLWVPRAASLVWGGVQGAQPGQLNHPRDLVISPDGVLYVADSLNHRIQAFDLEGNYLFGWGSATLPDGGAASPGTFNQPWGVAVGPNGDVYVADTWNHRIQVFTAQGEFIREWGQLGQLEAAVGPYDFWGPRDVAVDSEGWVYVADTGNKRIRVYTSDGEFIRDIGSSGGGVGAGQLNEPVGLALHSDGRLFVADTWNRRIQVFDRAGQYLTSWMVNAWYGDQGNRPYLALDEARGQLYVVDPDASRVLVYDFFGTLLGSFGQPGEEQLNATQINIAAGVAIDAAGRVFVADAGASRILRFEPWDEIAVPPPQPVEATEEVTALPTDEVTEEPTADLTEEATDEVTALPTDEVTAEPTVEPTSEPTEETTPESVG